MLKYVGLAAIVGFLAVVVIGITGRSHDEAGAFEELTTGSCSVPPPQNPADPIKIGPTAMMDVMRHEIVGNQADAHVRLYPVQSDQFFQVTEPMIDGVMTFDTNTAQFEGSGEGVYFNPSIYSLNGEFGINPSSGAPTDFEGTLNVNAIEGNQPNLEFQVFCSFPQPTPTPEPTPSPTPGPFSIVVLKINDATNGPIADWEMELYANDDCSGDPIDSGTTNDDGIIDFIGLTQGIYSVLEEDDPSLTPDDGNLCREDIQVPGPSDTVGDGFATCPITNNEFPDTGCDSFDSGGQVNIELASGGEPFTVTIGGPTTIVRKTVPQDVTNFPVGSAQPAGTGNGLDEVETEMIQLDLDGLTSMFGTVHIHESPTRDSDGLFEEQANDTPGEMDFPADSFFDIFIEIDIPGVGTVYNQDPLRMQCTITDIPPLLCLYQPPIEDPIPLYFSDDDELFAYIVHAAHVPIPSGEVLVIFRNVPATEKILIMGDWDCDGDSDAVDALVTLSFLAALNYNQHQPCPDFESEVAIATIVLLWGDVDCDGDVDTVDVLKILQFIAGLSFEQTQPCPTILDP